MVGLPKGFAPPSTKRTAFECPHCGTKTTQYWYSVRGYGLQGLPEVRTVRLPGRGSGFPIERDKPVRFIGPVEHMDADAWLENCFISLCMECKDFALWFGSKMSFPTSNSAPAPHPDLPEEMKSDYKEAAQILSQSPRGAAALLRLVVEKLCHHLGYKQKSIDANIAKMVEDGLPHEVERALDIVRVVGNGAVHPGHLDLKDDQTTATKLFEIVNYIVLDRITRPKELEQIFNAKVPQGAKDSIAKRRKKPLEKG